MLGRLQIILLWMDSGGDLEREGRRPLRVRQLEAHADRTGEHARLQNRVAAERLVERELRTRSSLAVRGIEDCRVERLIAFVGLDPEVCDLEADGPVDRGVGFVLDAHRQLTDVALK